MRTYNPKIKDIAARYTPNANDPARVNDLVHTVDVDISVEIEIIFYMAIDIEFPERFGILPKQVRQ